jgi:hypothetical protein
MLTNCENGSANLMLVAEANGFFGDAHDGKVLTYAAGNEQRGVFRKVASPRKVVTFCIAVNSLVRAAMNAQISLLVAIEPNRSDTHRTIDRSFYKSAQYTVWPKWAGTTHMDRGHHCL